MLSAVPYMLQKAPPGVDGGSQAFAVILAVGRLGSSSAPSGVRRCLREGFLQDKGQKEGQTKRRRKGHTTPRDYIR